MSPLPFDKLRVLRKGATRRRTAAGARYEDRLRAFSKLFLLEARPRPRPGPLPTPQRKRNTSARLKSCPDTETGCPSTALLAERRGVLEAFVAAEEAAQEVAANASDAAPLTHLLEARGGEDAVGQAREG